MSSFIVNEWQIRSLLYYQYGESYCSNYLLLTITTSFTGKKKKIPVQLLFFSPEKEKTNFSSVTFFTQVKGLSQFLDLPPLPWPRPRPLPRPPLPPLLPPPFPPWPLPFPSNFIFMSSGKGSILSTHFLKLKSSIVSFSLIRKKHRLFHIGWYLTWKAFTPTPIFLSGSEWPFLSKSNNTMCSYCNVYHQPKTSI